MNGMTPEMMQAILRGQGGEQDPRTQDLQRQQAMVNAMRQRTMQGAPGHTMAGRVAVPNIGGAVGSAASGFMAGQQQPGITAGMEQQNAMQGEQRKAYMQALINAMRMQGPQAPTPQPAQPPQPGAMASPVPPQAPPQVTGY